MVSTPLPSTSPTPLVSFTSPDSSVATRGTMLHQLTRADVHTVELMHYRNGNIRGLIYDTTTSAHKCNMWFIPSFMNRRYVNLRFDFFWLQPCNSGHSGIKSTLSTES